jgi:hypothetical protein
MNEGQLQRANHICPKFIIKKMNKNGLFREKDDGKSLEKFQDSYAKYHYCAECDNNRFNRLGETPVAKAYKFHGRLGQVNPPEALDYFGVSIAFRSAINERSGLLEGECEAVATWGMYLLKLDDIDVRYPCRIVPTLFVADHPSILLQYSYDLGIEEIDGIRFVATHMPGFLIAGFLSDCSSVSSEKLDEVFNSAFMSRVEKLSAQNTSRRELMAKRTR